MEAREEDKGAAGPSPLGEVRRGAPDKERSQTPERPLLASPVPGEEKSSRHPLSLPPRALPLHFVERDRG